MGTFVRPFPYPPSYTSRINHPPSTPTPAYSVNICCSLLSSCGVVKELLLVVVACICLYLTMRCTKFVCVHVYDNPKVQQLFQPTTVLFFLSPHSDTLYTITCLQSGEPRPVLSLERLSLLGMPLSYPTMTLSSITSEPVLPVECSEQAFFWSIQQLFQSIVAPVPTCLKRVAGIQFRIRNIFTNIDEVTHIILNAV